MEYLTSKIDKQLEQTHINVQPDHLTVKVKPAKEVKQDEEWGTYPMASTPRGLAVILNFENFPDETLRRDGSNVDVLCLEELCKQLGFEVEIHRDLYRHTTLMALDSVINNPLMKTTDMLMVFIMSHGKDNKILCSDGLGIHKEDILCKFTSIELKGKPKFIVFEACRGNKIDIGMLNFIMTDQYPHQQNTKDSSWQDMLIANSSVNGYLSFRNPNGSWFIQTLVKVFMNNAWNKDLFLLLRDIGIELNEIPHMYKQSMEYSNRNFKKRLYFNPGLSKENIDKNSINPGLKNMKNVSNPGLKNMDDVSNNDMMNMEKNNKNPGVTNTDHSLERGSYKLQKIKTGSTVWCLQYDNDMIVAGLNNGSVHIYNKHTSILENNIKAHSNGVYCLQFDKNISLSGSQDKTVKIWQNYTYKLLNTLKLDSFVLCLKCNFIDMLVTGTLRGQLSVWRMHSPTDITLTSVLHSGGKYNCVDFDDKHIVNGCDDNIQFWSTKSLELLKTMTGHTDSVCSLQLKNNLVVSGSVDKSIRIWDIETGQCIRKLEGHNSYVWYVRFDARRIVSASDDKTIKIWDLEAALDTTIASDEVCIRTLKKHTDNVNCLQFDDTEIISGSDDRTIRIWNFQTTQ